MPYEPKPDTGTLFTNDRKTAENQPDMTGDILIAMPDGGAKKMRIAGWWKQGQRGEFLSIKISEPQQRQQDQGEQPARQQAPRQPYPQRRPAPRQQGDPSMRQSKAEEIMSPDEQAQADMNLPF